MLDVGPVTKPSMSGADTLHRGSSLAVARPAPVHLPGRAVEPVEAAVRVSVDADRRRATDDIDRGIEIDVSTQQVIFKAVERRSGEVIKQIPEEVVLKVRAYARAMRGGEADQGSELKAV